jgi:hypothetical protein
MLTLDVLKDGVVGVLSTIFQTFYHYKVNYFNYFFSYSSCDNL